MSEGGPALRNMLAIERAEARAEAAESEVVALREALREIVRLGSPFDAKGVHSKRVNDIAARALLNPVGTSEETA